MGQTVRGAGFVANFGAGLLAIKREDRNIRWSGGSLGGETLQAGDIVLLVAGLEFWTNKDAQANFRRAARRCAELCWMVTGGSRGSVVGHVRPVSASPGDRAQAATCCRQFCAACLRGRKVRCCTTLRPSVSRCVCVRECVCLFLFLLQPRGQGIHCEGTRVPAAHGCVWPRRQGHAGRWVAGLQRRRMCSHGRRRVPQCSTALPAPKRGAQLEETQLGPILPMCSRVHHKQRARQKLAWIGSRQEQHALRASGRQAHKPS